jgi:hypothetical protein
MIIRFNITKFIDLPINLFIVGIVAFQCYSLYYQIMQSSSSSDTHL